MQVLFVCAMIKIFFQRNKLERNHHLHYIKFLIFNLLLSRSYYFHFSYLIQTDRQSPCYKASSKIKKSPCKYQINYEKNSLIRCHLHCITIRQMVSGASICIRIGSELDSLKTDTIWKQASGLWSPGKELVLFSPKTCVLGCYLVCTGLTKTEWSGLRTWATQLLG